MRDKFNIKVSADRDARQRDAHPPRVIVEESFTEVPAEKPGFSSVPDVDGEIRIDRFDVAMSGPYTQVPVPP
jgi:hypothetical protein